MSGNLEVIDIDEKYSLDGNLFKNYKRIISEVNKDLLKKLVVQKTPSGGHHLIYRCQHIEGNLKLAQRYTTPQEKNQTYLEEIKSGATKEVALKRAENDKVRVLLETRGEGGQIVCYPSKGYEIIYGDYYSIHEITLDERETLINIARQFNEIITESRPDKKVENRKGIKGLSSFDDYNERGDVVSLLEKYGWKIISNKGNKTVF
ncbi:MAG: bifunctional DNA primase/polymerase [Chitinophagaceae bacterium]|nr:bifunctional DNA primase/polymerase [Chitinophagaceae bacterium]